MQNEVRTPTAAWKAFDQFADDDRVTFYAEPEHKELQGSFRQLATEKHFAHQQWPDAYLVAFARVGGLVLVTFDRGLKALAGKDTRLLR